MPVPVVLTTDHCTGDHCPSQSPTATAAVNTIVSIEEDNMDDFFDIAFSEVSSPPRAMSTKSPPSRLESLPASRDNERWVEILLIIVAQPFHQVSQPERVQAQQDP